MPTFRYSARGPVERPPKTHNDSLDWGDAAFARMLACACARDTSQLKKVSFMTQLTVTSLPIGSLKSNQPPPSGPGSKLVHGTSFG